MCANPICKRVVMGVVCLPQVAEEAEADFARAQEKYEESRRIKSDYYDAYVSLGNLDFERGKLALGLAVPPPQCAPTSLQFLILDPGVPQTMIITMAFIGMALSVIVKIQQQWEIS